MTFLFWHNIWLFVHTSDTASIYSLHFFYIFFSLFLYFIYSIYFFHIFLFFSKYTLSHFTCFLNIYEEYHISLLVLFRLLLLSWIFNLELFSSFLNPFCNSYNLDLTIYFNLLSVKNKSWLFDKPFRHKAIVPGHQAVI